MSVYAGDFLCLVEETARDNVSALSGYIHSAHANISTNQYLKGQKGFQLTRAMFDPKRLARSLLP
jgi:hypothetical protein